MIDKLLFFGAGAAVLFLVQEIDRRLGIRGPDSVNFDVYDLLVIQAPLTLVITYALWMLVIVKFGPPGRRLTNTEVRRHPSGAAGQPRKMVRAAVKTALHLTLVGLIADAIFIMRDQRERRSIPDLMAGTIIAPRR